MQLDRILVAVDFSESSNQAASWVAKNMSEGREVVVFHCANSPLPPKFLLSVIPHLEQVIENQRVGAEKRLREFASTVGADVTTRLAVGGRAHEAIIACAEDCQADLIVLGPHGDRGTLSELMMGSVPEKLIRSTSLPIFVARGLPTGPPKTILAPVDESETARHSFEWAVGLARIFGAKVIALQAVSTWYAHQLERVASEHESAKMIQEQQRVAKEWLDHFVKEVGASDVSIETKVRAGSPDAEILHEATESKADCIVMGSRGSGGAIHPFMGSVARYVLRNATCSTLVASSAE